MKKRLKKSTLLAAATLAACTLTFSVGLAVADGNAFQGGAIADTFDIYSTVTLPAGSFGQTQATALVTYPDGSVVTADKELILDQGGVYGVEYRAVVDGKVLKHTDEFTVETPLYSLASEKSSASYGVDEDDVWSSWNSGREGIMLSLAPKDTFRYNDVINVYESSVSNYAFQFAFAPTTVGKSDAQAMYISFTDIYDADNQVTIWLKTSTGAGIVTYMMSKANDQPWTGREYNGNRGEMWHQNNMYGTPAYISSGGAWYGNPNADILDLGFYFVKETNQLWYRASRDNNATGALTNDFDNLDLQVEPWKGFTTGEVYVDVWCESYNADTMNLLIMNVCGQDLSREKLVDEQGPTFTFADDGLTEAEKGKGYAGYSYPVAAASAIDKYSRGNVPYTVNAYYNYSRGTGEYDDFNGTYSYEVEIQDGYFKTQYEGTYALVYRTEDWYGNKTEKVVSVAVGAQTAAPAISGLTLTTPVTQAKVGNIVDLPALDGYQGGSGRLTPCYEVRVNGQSVEISGNVIDGCYFVPQTAGTYTVVAGVCDALKNKQTESYEVTVATTADASIDMKAKLPKYLITGAKYNLPKLMATNYATGKQVTAAISVTDGDGTRDCTENTVFKPDANGNATITYKAGENSYSYVLPVVTVKTDKGLYDLEKYFVTDGGVSVTSGTLGMEMTAQADGSVTYIRELLTDYFSLQFTISAESNSFEKLGIVLTDAYDSTVSVCTEITRNNGKACGVYINGKDTEKKFANATFQTGTQITYQYLGESRTGSVETLALNYETTVSGEKFNGFPSGLVYVTLEFTGVDEGASVQLATISGQRFNASVYSDTTAPSVHVNGTFTRTVASVGDRIDVFSAIANDVLDPYTSLTVSVMCGNEYAVATDGTKLQNAPADKAYQFVINALGQYDIRYTAKDGSNKTAYAQVRYTVYDTVKPTLTLESEMKLNRSIGEIELPKATATDDVTEAENMRLYVTVANPYGIVSYVKDFKFTATEKGMYEIRYTAYDEIGNVTSAVYVISVS